MRRMLFAGALTLAVAATSVAEARSRCEAYAHDRKVTGTVVGAIGGGLLGSAIAGHGSKGTGALVGAGLGAVVGNNLSRVSCDRYAARRAHYRHARRGPAAYPRYTAASASCHYVNRPYYDQAGQLAYAPMQVCD
jgi:uncharacterized protein YcfJ